jgi:metal-responsive CopG/Arc/MetJ family transcriptional regulator
MATEFRTSLLLPPDLLEKLDDYWHTKRLESRNEAIRELLHKALDTEAVSPLLRRLAAKEQRR